MIFCVACSSICRAAGRKGGIVLGAGRGGGKAGGGAMEVGRRRRRREGDCVGKVGFIGLGFGLDGVNRKRWRGCVSCCSVVILGGTGRIGTAAAIHLLSVGGPDVEVVLAGRGTRKGGQAVEEVKEAVGNSGRVCFKKIDASDRGSRLEAFKRADVVINTAGPFGEYPSVLKEAIDFGVKKYVDVADPISYIDAGRKLPRKDTTAILSAGAFPGLSNLLALECAKNLGEGERVQNLEFNYFTAGLGGSGTVNLYITNVGFGTPVPTYRSGMLSPRMNAGRDPQQIDFFFDKTDASFRRVGKRNVWSWPFPEVATVSQQLHIRGDSNVRMGTAPEIWNVVMSGMAEVIPPRLWTNKAFSTVLAKFSEPLVAFTDAMLRGETHAIRVDVFGEHGGHVAAIQAHDSFRVCVGQSVAEFALYLHRQSNLPKGVFTPEEILSDDRERADVIEKMTTTPGTFTYRIKKLV